MRVTPIADYHQVYLAPAETYPVFDPARPDDLVQVAPDRRSLIIVTGIAMGPITLDVDLVDVPDDGAGADGTEQSAGALILDQPLYLLAPTIDTGVPDPIFTPPHAGTYAFRITATDRKKFFDQFVEEPVEFYRIHLWAVQTDR
jgi:hypothetical protein